MATLSNFSISNIWRNIQNRNDSPDNGEMELVEQVRNRDTSIIVGGDNVTLDYHSAYNSYIDSLPEISPGSISLGSNTSSHINVGIGVNALISSNTRNIASGVYGPAFVDDPFRISPEPISAYTTEPSQVYVFNKISVRSMLKGIRDIAELEIKLDKDGDTFAVSVSLIDTETKEIYLNSSEEIDLELTKEE